MERLTIKKRFKHHRPEEETTAVCVDGYIQIVEPIEYATHATSHYYLVGKAIDKLAEYEDAEEQGLVVRLPCKIGDTVYEASSIWGRVLKRKVTEIVVCNNSIWIKIGCGDSFEYGVEVFITKEEAEKALEEMEK